MIQINLWLGAVHCAFCPCVALPGKENAKFGHICGNALPKQGRFCHVSWRHKSKGTMQADFSTGTAFDIVQPAEQRVPFVFCSAHSGRAYPARFLGLSQLDAWQIRRSEDCLVDHLFSGVAALGAPLLRAHFPRAYIDANREPLELDPAMFAGALPAANNGASPRVAAGLGTIPRIVGEGRAIYAGKLAPEDALMRLESCYFPFHAALRSLIERSKARFGFCVLVDCHSMPGQIINHEDGSQPHIVIGDRFGQSAGQSLSHCCGRPDIRSATTGLMRAASSPSTTASLKPVFMPCKSKSADGFIWMKPAMLKHRASRAFKPI
jgi:N-formylglutamate amidohydrolase